jgi:hypothetical protein
MTWQKGFRVLECTVMASRGSVRGSLPKIIHGYSQGCLSAYKKQTAFSVAVVLIHLRNPIQTDSNCFSSKWILVPTHKLHRCM